MRNLLLLLTLSAAHVVAAAFKPIALGPSEDQIVFAKNASPFDARKHKPLEAYEGRREGDCTVNIAEAVPDVHEDYTHRGIYFWAYGAAIEDYCLFWEDHFHIGERFPFFQPHCYFDESKGQHRVDTSWFNGDEAAKEFDRAKKRSLEWWMEYSGCRTAGNEMCWGKCT